ncbi:MAG TPA: AI-2E family transporter YdiK [Planctomycetota bacterium]
MTPLPTRDLTRTTFAVLLLVGMLMATFWILQPFLAALVWAALLVIACWPMLLGLQRKLGDRRGVAIALTVTALLLAFVVPVTLILGVLITRAPDLAAWVRHLMETGLPPPPAWVASVPVVGTRAAEKWTELASAGPEGLPALVGPYLEQLGGWFVAQAGGVGRLAFHFVLMVLFVGVLFARGEVLAAGVRAFGRRLAGERGDRVVVLAAQGIRAVAIGVVVTALVQSLAGGIGLLIAGLPVPGLLTAVMFLSSLAQIGAAPVLALAAIWLFANDSIGWGIAMIVWTVLVGSLDNVIRPILIKKGVDLPLVLLFAGVIGGLIAFGPVGLFVGPVVLAVGYTLLTSWMAETAAPEGEATAAAG